MGRSTLFPSPWKDYIPIESKGAAAGVPPRLTTMVQKHRESVVEPTPDFFPPPPPPPPPPLLVDAHDISKPILPCQRNIELPEEEEVGTLLPPPSPTPSSDSDSLSSSSSSTMSEDISGVEDSNIFDSNTSDARMKDATLVEKRPWMRRSVRFHRLAETKLIETRAEMDPKDKRAYHYSAEDMIAIREREKQLIRQLSCYGVIRGRNEDVLGLEDRIGRYYRRQRVKEAIFSVLLEQELLTRPGRHKEMNDDNDYDNVGEQDPTLVFAEVYQEHTGESVRLAVHRAKINAVQVGRSDETTEEITSLAVETSGIGGWSLFSGCLSRRSSVPMPSVPHYAPASFPVEDRSASHACLAPPRPTRQTIAQSQSKAYFEMAPKQPAEWMMMRQELIGSSGNNGELHENATMARSPPNHYPHPPPRRVLHHPMMPSVPAMQHRGMVATTTKSSEHPAHMVVMAWCPSLCEYVPTTPGRFVGWPLS